MKNKIYGSLIGAAIGDALGAPTELRNRDQIIDLFGGKVKGFIEPPKDTFASGRIGGQVTDDFSMIYYLLKVLIESGGIVNDDVMKNSVIYWGNDKEYFDKFAGPTTRLAIENIKKGLPTDIDPYGLVNFNSKATNGCAMKVAPLALLSKGDLDQAVEYSFKLSKVTHFNSLAISGAAAVACAISKSMESDNLNEVFEAALYGAKEGEKLGKLANRISVGASVTARIERAIELALKISDIEKLIAELNNQIGNTWCVTESVPSVFGIIAGVKGNTMEGIIEAANFGGDTDTMASIVGAILGCFNGVDSLDSDLKTKVIEANIALDIEKILNKFYAIYKGRIS